MTNNGYRQKDFGQPVKRYCQFLEIEDNPKLIELYRMMHSRAEAWPEVLAGIREAGILEMELYIVGNKVVMIVDTPIDFDWDSAMARLASMPRQAEWEAAVAALQGCSPDATSDQKWTMMERMFHLYD
ncbi:MAG: L-rhamnose mutarotase [Candidatus Amulumruptor sp.]|nr:L-rhamnose mutarotase [Paramuribaculum sp.]MDE7151467.1 L-rhamnose mutarotase [Candidatus Amulumruptor sp.]